MKNIHPCRFDDDTEDWVARDIGAWMGGHIILTQSADGRTWTVTDPEVEDDLVLGFGVIEGGEVINTYFENGALKQDFFRVMEEGAYEWVDSSEFKLTRGDELVNTFKESRYIEVLDMQIVFTKTFLARRRVH
jgi:hypothetical protein